MLAMRIAIETQPNRCLFGNIVERMKRMDWLLHIDDLRTEIWSKD